MMGLIQERGHYAISTGIVLAALCLPVLPQTETQARSTSTVVEAGHSAGKKLTLAGVKNFGEVTPMLYRGAQPSREGFKALAGMGIDMVVDLRLSGQDGEKKTVMHSGMQYVSIPWHCMFPRDRTMAQFLAVLRENPRKKIFVHCRYGNDRTGMMIAAYRIAVENWTVEEAGAEMQQFGFSRTVCFPLLSYEKEFPQRLKHDAGLREAAVAQR
jgi:tyrosine-protein phosphatase SIW14